MARNGGLSALRRAILYPRFSGQTMRAVHEPNVRQIGESWHCGPTVSRWRGLVARAKISEYRSGRIVIVVSAISPFSQHPTPLDVCNAELTALVLLNTLFAGRTSRAIELRLLYANGVTRSIKPDLPRVENELAVYSSSSRGNGAFCLPTQCVAFLMNDTDSRR